MKKIKYVLAGLALCGMFTLFQADQAEATAVDTNTVAEATGRIFEDYPDAPSYEKTTRIYFFNVSWAPTKLGFGDLKNGYLYMGTLERQKQMPLSSGPGYITYTGTMNAVRKLF
ncbi:hypothetical protein I6N96_13160 [Enterococcus sp. BWM-S5]|uniref:Uncharacterized protein n=1 Tax=Enterococcus larvae TaxID=2794352 RepID=A0ABS4CLA5_9ENTE|nr:hypothetical protein [Enterococcus larvae]MBP1047225.1 hypothetical protein [Enterococcus larvae]